MFLITLSLFHLFGLWDVCFPKKREKERKGMEFGGQRDREDMGSLERGKILIRIYYKKEVCSKKKNLFKR